MNWCSFPNISTEFLKFRSKFEIQIRFWAPFPMNLYSFPNISTECLKFGSKFQIQIRIRSPFPRNSALVPKFWIEFRSNSEANQAKFQYKFNWFHDFEPNSTIEGEILMKLLTNPNFDQISNFHMIFLIWDRFSFVAI